MNKIKVDASKLSKLNYILKKLDTPRAYSAYATIGVVVTTALAIVCTRKQCKYEKNLGEDIPENKSERHQIVKDTVKNYCPVIVSAVATIGCIRKADTKWADYTKLINHAYIASRDKMARYRMLAAPAVAAEVVQGLDGKKSEPGVEWFCLKDVPIIGDITSDGIIIDTNIKCDGHTGVRSAGYTKDIYFQSTKADVIEAEYHLNRNFQLRGSASVREFFAFLGILDQFPHEFGDAIGWDCGVMMDDWGIEPWIDFEHWHTTDQSTNEVINVIAFTWEPHFNEDASPLAYGYDIDHWDYFPAAFSLGPKE